MVSCSEPSPDIVRVAEWLNSTRVKIGPMDSPEQYAGFLEHMATQVRRASCGRVEFQADVLHELMAVVLASLYTLDAEVNWEIEDG